MNQPPAPLLVRDCHRHRVAPARRRKATGSANRWPLRWDLLLRYRYLETIALWEGRLTTRHLCEAFGIGRQQASKDINQYLREVGPGNLEYDKYLKGYRPSAAFEPKVTRGHADEYLHLMARNEELSSVFDSLSLEAENVELLSLPVRDVRPETLRPLVLAARQHRRVEVDYVSVANPDREGRIIAPHTLVYTGLRWHVRAWCEKNRGYRDFVLSRFRGVPELLDVSRHRAESDEDWNTLVAVDIVAHPGLTLEQREVIAQDYGMQNGMLRLELRARLVPYALQLLHIEPDDAYPTPEAQQIVLANRESLSPWLFR